MSEPLPRAMLALCCAEASCMHGLLYTHTATHKTTQTHACFYTKEVTKNNTEIMTIKCEWDTLKNHNEVVFLIFSF